MNHIDRIETRNTGGGIMVDFVFLKSGQVITISDDSVLVNESEEAWYDGNKELIGTVYLPEDI